MSEPVPARRSPTGYVAQRLFPDEMANRPSGPRGRWVHAYFQENVGLAVEVLTDDEVADWPLLTTRGDL